jgi:hypothetical protein
MNEGDKWTYNTNRTSGTSALQEGTEVVYVGPAEMLNEKKVYPLHTTVACVEGVEYYSFIEDVPVFEKMVAGDVMSEPSSPVKLQIPTNNKRETISVTSKIYIKGEFQGEAKLDRETYFEGLEDVTVLAGTFEKCIKITDSDYVHSESFTCSMIRTRWLAKGVGVVKEVQLYTCVNYKYAGDQPELNSINTGGCFAQRELKNALIKGQKIGE